MRKIKQEFNSICPKYGEKVKGYVEYLDSSTLEKHEYSKNDVQCNFKHTYSCTRNDCPYCVDMPDVI